MHYKFSAAAWKDWQLIQRFDDVARSGTRRKGGYVTELVNRKLGAAFSPSDLDRYAMAMSRVATIQAEADSLRGKVDQLRPRTRRYGQKSH